jgi:hypothetical protein
MQRFENLPLPLGEAAAEGNAGENHHDINNRRLQKSKSFG